MSRDILLFLKTIWQEGDVREIRAFDQIERVSFGYFDSPEKAAKVALDLSKTHVLYITLNPVKPELLARASNRIKQATKKSSATTDSDIAELRYLLVDCDPKYPVKGISSSQTELIDARAVATKITESLGMPLVMGMSGNGFHLIYRHNTQDAHAIKAFLANLNAQFGQNETSVDTTVFNPARITKILGTWARKGDNTQERPHRQSQILTISENSPILNIPPIVEIPKAMPTTTSKPNTMLDLNIVLGDRIREVKEEATRTLYILNECIFDPSHKGKDAMVVQDADGKICYHCFHTSCQGKTWHDVKAALGMPSKPAPTCNRCGAPIAFKNENGRWIPTDISGFQHVCMKKETPVVVPTPKAPESDLIEYHDKSRSLWDIYNTEYPPLYWPVEGLIPQGLTILAGPPKTGKSYLCTQLALAAAGVSYDREIVSTPEKNVISEALYLALEDSDRRIKDRLVALIPKPTRAIERIRIETHWGKGVEAIEQLKGYLATRDFTGLVIVDTLARVKAKTDSRRQLYDLDTESLEGWQKLAQDRGISIVIVHHTRKAEADDSIDRVSGSTAITGIADAILVLQRVRGQKTAVLSITGRDIEETELALEFEAPAWRILGDSKNVSAFKATRRIQEALAGIGGKGTPKEIMKHLLDLGEDANEATIRKQCGRALQMGALHLAGYGTYTLIDYAETIVVPPQKEEKQTELFQE